MVTLDAVTVGARIAAAIAALTPEQCAALEVDRQRRGLAGRKQAIAALAGITSPSVLSDMLADRVVGLRHHAALAEVLAVDVRWLRDGVEPVPDWMLPPMEAFERWADGLLARWHRHPGNRHAGDDVRASAVRLAAFLGQEHGVEPWSRAIAGRLAAQPVSAWLLLTEFLGCAPPAHHEHLCAGHRLTAVVEVRLQSWRRRLRRRQDRLALPGQVFRVTRLALVTLRHQYRNRPALVTAFDDALELLWRQQALRHRLGANIPEGLTRDTGRTTWSSLVELHQRHHDDQDWQQPWNG